MITLENLPTHAIVPAGGLEAKPNPELSLPSKLRIEALAVLAISGAQIDSVIFSGGLEIDGVVEAPAQRQYLDKILPNHGMEVRLDTDCYDTHSSARSVAAMPGVLERPHLFIASKSFMPRAKGIFSSHGIDLAPVVAEDALLDYGDDAQSCMADGYLHSVEHYKRLALESLMRGLLLADRNGRLSQRLAASSRAKMISRQTDA